MNHPIRYATALLVLSLSLASAAPPIAGSVALDWAFRFASAITSDDRDRSKAQQVVVLDLAEIGQLESAARRADSIVGWHRGAAYADIAALYAASGDEARARALIAKAESAQREAEGWHGPRIATHVAQAHAMLGEPASAAAIADSVAAADPRQYSGRAAATRATAHAARGEFDQAMALLDGLGGDDDLEIAWARVTGYVAVARQPRVTAKQRRTALDAALTAAATVPGWKQAEALESLADEFRRDGALARARELLRRAEALVLPITDTLSIRPALLSNLARKWAGVGDVDHARLLLAEAEAAVPSAMTIERPPILANIASSWVAVGATTEASRVYGMAFDAAETLVNARPRALAVVEICRSMGKARLDPEAATRQRLESLLAGLRDPW